MMKVSVKSVQHDTVCIRYITLLKNPMQSSTKSLLISNPYGRKPCPHTLPFMPDSLVHVDIVEDPLPVSTLHDLQVSRLCCQLVEVLPST